MSKARDIASAAPAPSTVSATEIGYLDGVTSAIQTQVDAKIAKSTATTKGDLLAATASATVARLGVGSNNTVLTADSAEATGLKWATPSSGGMTLISTTTLSSTGTTISVPAGYVDIVAYVYGVTNATGNDKFCCLPNGDASIVYTSGTENGATTGAAGGSLFMTPTTPLRTDANNSFHIKILNYASTAAYKPIENTFIYISNASAQKYGSQGGMIKTTSGITSLVFQNLSSYTLLSGTVLLYGIK